MELAEAEEVGSPDHQRVDRGHVDPRLDDGRADEDVGLAIGEVHHDGLERALVHLAVGDGHRGLWHELTDASSGIVDVRHPVVDEEGLALSEQLAADRLADRPVLVLSDVGEDGTSIDRRGAHHGEVADPGERHLERARDRARRQGEHVDALRQPLDRLFVRDAESLLLVDHQQAQVLEGDVLGEEAVRADHDVDGPVTESPDDGRRLGIREEAAEQRHVDGVAAEALGDRLMVLGCQEGGRNEHRHLLVVLDSLEGGSHRDLGLAESHVRADQPVHRPGCLHVGLHLGDGPALVRRLDEGEGRLHLLLPGAVRGEGVPRGHQPGAIERHELLGHL